MMGMALVIQVTSPLFHEITPLIFLYLKGEQQRTYFLSGTHSSEILPFLLEK